MPVYLFSFHAYRSWMPNHPRGYTRRGMGYQRPDAKMHQNYEARASNPRSWFDPDIQRAIIERAQEACAHLKCRLHSAGTERGHLHFLMSWKSRRTWSSVRASFRSSLTRFLNENFPDVAFSRGASRKRVKDRPHFNHLMSRYLPGHPGWGWYEDREWIAPRP